MEGETPYCLSCGRLYRRDGRPYILEVSRRAILRKTKDNDTKRLTFQNNYRYAVRK